MIGIVFVLLVAYIMGSFPIGFWVGQILFKKDITALGSGNIGATNAYRILGPLPGSIVFLGDFFKGAAPVAIMKQMQAPAQFLPWLVIAAGVLAMLGHTYSVFLKFKGGKAISTTLGVIAILVPQIAAILLAIWLLCLALTRYVSFSSIIAATIFPVLIFIWFKANVPLLIFSLLVAILVIYRHRSNIGRLFNGTEPKVGS